MRPLEGGREAAILTIGNRSGAGVELKMVSGNAAPRNLAPFIAATAAGLHGAGKASSLAEMRITSSSG